MKDLAQSTPEKAGGDPGLTFDEIVLQHVSKV